MTKRVKNNSFKPAINMPMPIAVGQKVTTASQATLSGWARQSIGIIGAEHLALSGVSGHIATILKVDQGSNCYYFYTIEGGSSLLWPHPAFQERLDSRPLTLNESTPQFERAPRDLDSSITSSTRTAPGFIPPRDPTRLYAGNISYDMQDVSLLRLLTRFGDVDRVEVVTDKMTGRSKGFAIVKYCEVLAALKAINNLHEQEILPTGELASTFSSPDYQQWLRDGWHVLPTNAAEPAGKVAAAERVIAIVQESSRLLAECIANHPDSLLYIEWRDFERMLATVFQTLGFQVQCGTGSKDGGIDLIISTSTSTFSVQAKHWVSGKRVSSAVLSFAVTVAIKSGHEGAIVLSTSGFSRDAIQAVTTVKRSMLRIGQSEEVHSLCRTYLGVSQGLLHPQDANSILLAHTRKI